MSTEKNIAKMILRQTKGATSGVKEAVTDLYGVLEERKLLHLLPAIAREIKKMSRGRLEEEKVIIRTADKDFLKNSNILKKIGASGDRAVIVEDGSIIAGAKIKFNGKEFDTSAKGQVSRLYRALIS